MNSKNMNYAFQVEYQEQAVWNRINNKELLKVLNDQGKSVIAWGRQHVNALTSATTRQLRFKTMYPGVLIGTGYPHQTGIPTGEIQVGFSFDYVTGAPYYLGSSLKGVLRNVFDNALCNENDNLYMSYIKDILQEVGSKALSDNLREFVNLAFGKEHTSDELEGGTDIFYGGFIVEYGQNIIGMDSITPHGTDLTKNPIPISMIRILPEVEITFVIDIKNSDELDRLGYTKEVRCNLYRKILEDFGIGAKRNVGYGNLIGCDTFQN